MAIHRVETVLNTIFMIENIKVSFSVSFFCYSIIYFLVIHLQMMILFLCFCIIWSLLNYNKIVYH